MLRTAARCLLVADANSSAYRSGILSDSDQISVNQTLCGVTTRYSQRQVLRA